MSLDPIGGKADMKYVTCQVVQETNSRDSGHAMIRIEDLGGGLTQLRIEFGPTTTRFVLAETGIAQLHELLGEIVADHAQLAKPRLKAVGDA